MADAVFYSPTQSNPRASFSGSGASSPTFEAEIKTTNHEKLNGRDLPDQHPMSAITGLLTALANLTDGITTEELERKQADLELQQAINNKSSVIIRRL